MNLELPSILTHDHRQNLEKGHLKMTNMFKEFDRICRKYNLKYWCVGGTLIGAIRHKGWIPWDDDIDVHMLDTDWEIFMRIWKEELPTTTIALNGNSGKIIDLYSCYEESPMKDYHNGLHIDVFKYADKVRNSKRMLEYYVRIRRDDHIYRDTEDFEYDLIFPLKELQFEGINVYVPGQFEEFCRICYGSYPPEIPPIDKRVPEHVIKNVTNPDPVVLELFKNIYAERTHEWFRRRAAQHSPDTPLHHSSGWSYLSTEKWEEFVNHCTQYVEISEIKSIFEGGCGVGAVLKTLCLKNPLLELHGMDICKEAVERCTENVPNVQCYVGNITELSKHGDASFDFVLSNCVLSYLNTHDDVKQAVNELIRIAKPRHRIHLCVFTELPEYLKSLRLCVEKSWWGQFADKVDIEIQDIGMPEFKGRYSVFMTKK